MCLEVSHLVTYILPRKHVSSSGDTVICYRFLSLPAELQALGMRRRTKIICKHLAPGELRSSKGQKR